MQRAIRSQGFGAGALALAVALAACSGTGTSATGSRAPDATAGSQSSGQPAMTQAFTSGVYGYRLMFPAGFDPHAATKAVPNGSHTWSSDDGTVDHFIGEGMGPLEIVSVLPGSGGATQWIDEQLQDQLLTGTAFPAVCATKVKSEPITVDGHAGVLNTTCAPALLSVLVPAGDRIYQIDLHGDPPDRAWLDAMLATVHLDPTSAKP